jgi:hypothetical protein
MFETRNVPCYLQSMSHKTLKIGSEEYKGTEIVFRVDPFTAELAGELSETKGVIFRRNTAEVNPNIDAVSFSYAPKPQRIEFRAAPELSRPSIVVAESKVQKFRVRKPKDGQQWVLVFRATFAEISGADLLWLKEALFEQRFLSFENAEAGLFDEAEKEAKRNAKEAKPVKPSRETDVPLGDMTAH